MPACATSCPPRLTYPMTTAPLTAPTMPALFYSKSITICRKITPPPSNTITPGPNRKTAPLMLTRGRAVPMRLNGTGHTPSTAVWYRFCPPARSTSSASKSPAKTARVPTMGRRTPIPGDPFPIRAWIFYTAIALACPSSFQSNTTTPASSCSTISL